jgi:hypothetical protein
VIDLDDRPTFTDRLYEAWWFIRDNARRAWLIVKRRPFLRCPFCKGEGGAVQGYYEPEWTECRVCFDHWNELDDYSMPWFVGRLPLLQWIRAKVAQRFGLWYVVSVREALLCRLGFHRWRPEDGIEPGLRICCRCYEHDWKPEATKESQ